MQAFIATVEESSQQREGTPRPLDQGGFGGCADLCVLGQKATFPVKYQGGFLERPDSVGSGASWDAVEV
jgi:hypothetical protein